MTRSVVSGMFRRARLRRREPVRIFPCDMCPHCRQHAPIVYRGVVPHCTACGRVRAPFTTRSVNLAGRPAAVGGTVANVLGWVVLGVGGALALGLGLLFSLLTPTAGLAVGITLGIIALTLGLVLVLSGRKLQRSGAADQKDTRRQAIYALAGHRGGVLTVVDVSQALGISPEEADVVLTDLAKTQPDQCVLELDEAGAIYFRFGNAPWTADSRFRVGEPPPVQTRVVGDVVEVVTTIDDVEQAVRASRSAR